MITNTRGDRKVAHPHWPDLPKLAAGARAEMPDLARWEDQLQKTWYELRSGLDRMAVGSSINANGFHSRLFRPSVSYFTARDTGGSGGGFRPGGLTFTHADYLTDLEGVRHYYTTYQPNDAREGDIWYDIGNLFRVHYYKNGKWVDVFADVPTLDAQIIAGLPHLDGRALLAEALARQQESLARQDEALARQQTILAEAKAAAAGLVSIERAATGSTFALVSAKMYLEAKERSALAQRVTAIAVDVDGALAAITLEETARIAADGTITANLTAEITARATGDTASLAAVTTEETARIAADGTITASVATEISAREAGDSTAMAAITSEETARIAADGTITSNLNTEITARGAGDDASLAAVATEESARIAADGTITASITTEVAARSAGDDASLAAVTTEQTARIAADGSLGAEYVLAVATGGTSGRRITGFRITNHGGAGGATEFVIQTDKFTLVDTSGDSPRVPFTVFGGLVFIDKAVIREVSAGAILAGTIEVALTLGVAGSITASSGSNRFYTDSNGTIFGDSAGKHIKINSYFGVTTLTLWDGAVVQGFWTANSGSGGSILDLGSTASGVLQNLGMIYTQKIQALNTSEPGTTDSPLMTLGGAYIAKSLTLNSIIKKATEDGWSPPLKGTNNISFKWDGTNLLVKVDVTELGAITIVP